MTQNLGPIIGGFWAECPDCGGHRYPVGTDANRYGEGYTLLQCDSECNEGLASIDIMLEFNEEAALEPDETGRKALWIRQHDEIEESE